jgi:hypothetical protein
MPVNISCLLRRVRGHDEPDVGLGSGPERGDIGDLEVEGLGDRADSQVADGARAGTEEHRSDIGDDLVDEAGAQERRGQRRAALEEHVLPVERVQLCQGLVRIARAELDRLGAHPVGQHGAEDPPV